jgi:4-hydroxy-4-methyl-2-oxoglutarate aldolase
VRIEPGDVVVADDDGVVVVALLSAEKTRAAAVERLAKEEKTRERLRSGELGLDFYGLRQKLDELGVRWVDTAGDV